MGQAMRASDPSSDPSDVISGFGKNVTAVGDKLSAYLPVIGGITKVTGELVGAFAELMKNIDATAKRYQPYSPDISQAQALSDIRQTMGDFRRAQTIAPDMAKYIQARSDLEQKFEERKIKVLTQILPTVTRCLETLDKVLPSMENIDAPLQIAGELLKSILTVAEQLKKLVGDGKEEERRDKLKTPTEQILNNMKFKQIESEGGWVPNL